MPADERYRRQVALLVRVLPLIAQEKCFALKGGTAINLFIRNLPRLSVDIDLAYLPVSDREDMVAGMVGEMPEEHRRFLLSFQLGTPEWQLLEMPHAENLPAVRWRMMKWAGLEGGQRERLVDQLRSALEGGIRFGTTPVSGNLKK